MELPAAAMLLLSLCSSAGQKAGDAGQKLVLVKSWCWSKAGAGKKQVLCMLAMLLCGAGDDVSSRGRRDATHSSRRVHDKR